MLTLISLASFLIASALFLLGFSQSKLAELATRLALALGMLGTVTLSIECARVIRSLDFSNLTPHTAALLFSTSLAWTSVAAIVLWNMRLVGTLTSPLVALTLMSDVFFTNLQPIPIPTTYTSTTLVWFHVGSAMVGQGFAVIACAASLMLLWQQKKLKQRLLHDVPDTFPALTTLSSALIRTLWIGFSCITVSLISGAMITSLPDVTLGSSLRLKVLWAILVWTWYLTILVLHSILSYRPQKIAKMSLIGLAILATSWFGLAFSRSWVGT
jgi:ABC-type uncharacterized transport system permease subunit